MRSNADLDHAPYGFWEYIDAIHGSRFLTGPKFRETPCRCHGGLIALRGAGSGEYLGDPEVLRGETEQNCSEVSRGSPVFAALGLEPELPDYPIWKVRNDKALTDCAKKVGLLFLVSAEAGYHIVPSLLDLGVISTNTYLPWCSKLYDPKHLSQRLTVCEEALGDIMTEAFMPESCFFFKAERINVLVALMEYGGDPLCTISSIPGPRVSFSGEKVPVYGRHIKWRAKEYIHAARGQGWGNVPAQVASGETWSLRGWVASWKKEPVTDQDTGEKVDGNNRMMEVKDRLLELIDINMRKHDQLSDGDSNQGQRKTERIDAGFEAVHLPAATASMPSAETGTREPTPETSKQDAEATPSQQSQDAPAITTSVVEQESAARTSQHTVQPEQDKTKQSLVSVSPATGSTIPAFLLGILLTILVQYLLQRSAAQPPTS